MFAELEHRRNVASLSDLLLKVINCGSSSASSCLVGSWDSNQLAPKWVLLLFHVFQPVQKLYYGNTKKHEQQHNICRSSGGGAHRCIYAFCGWAIKNRD
eukprot:2876849-Karenia_brevis.AAC.1